MLSGDEWNDSIAYCNSVWCWWSEKDYKKRDKMDNNNPAKWVFTTEDEKNNYFDWTKVE